MIFFKWSNEISINGISNSQILDALNTMLGIIFTYTTNTTYTIHFVKKETISDTKLKKKIEVFNNFQQFFKNFKIENLQNILTKKFLCLTLQQYIILNLILNYQN